MCNETESKPEVEQLRVFSVLVYNETGRSRRTCIDVTFAEALEDFFARCKAWLSEGNAMVYVQSAVDRYTLVWDCTNERVPPSPERMEQYRAYAKANPNANVAKRE
jgi:hypothetical protein